MTYTIADLARVHGKIKDKRAKMAAEFKEADEALKEEQTKLRVALLGMLQAIGGTSVATPDGTVFRKEVSKAAAADWGAIWEWQVENDAPELVQKRLNVQFIDDYIKSQVPPEGVDPKDFVPHIPPGISFHREFDVSIRRS